MIPLEWLEQAEIRIQPHIYNTPLTYDPNFDIYLKWENHQVTGSFKVRGALNKTLTLQEWEREKGIVTASAGNHGMGVALAGKICEVPVTIFIPENTPPIKKKAILELGAEVQLVTGGYGDAEHAGIAYTSSRDSIWISPYNDGQVIAGQGTVGMEIFEVIQSSQAWLVPTGGGGLISGIGAVLDSVDNRPKLIGIQSEASPFMHDLFYHGSQENSRESPSIAEGLAGPVEDRSVTITLAKRFVDDFILVTEEEIQTAITYAWKNYNEMIEGSAAVSLAAILFDKVSSRPAILIITGGNIQSDVHANILAQQDLLI
jgi:threonine dehydratase